MSAPAPLASSTLPAEPAAAPVPPPLPSELPNAAWTSPAEQTAQRLILWGALGGISVLLVAVLGALLITRPDHSNTPSPAAASPAATDELPAEPNDSQPELDQPMAEEAEEPAAAAAEEELVAQEEPAREEAAAVAGALAEEVHEQPAEIEQAVEEGPPAPQAPAVLADKVKKANLPADETVFPAFAAPLEPVDPSIALSNLPNELPGGEPGGEANKPAGEAAIEVAEPAETIVVRRLPADENAAPIDLEARLADRLRSIELRAVPLVEWVRFFSNWTTLPISLDVSALQAAGIDLRMPVSVQQQDAAAAEVLTQALASIKLTYRADSGQIVVTTGVPAREVLLRVDDLVESNLSDTQQFARLVQTLVAPGSWQASGGRGTLRIKPGELLVTQTPGVLYEIVIFCEKLRVARGLSPRSRLNPQQFAFVPRAEKAAGLLAQPVTFTFHEPCELEQVTRFLEKQTGATLLIDWKSLAREQFAPATQITCAIEDRPLGEALSAILTPLNLSWRVVDDKVLEIYSLQEARSKAECEFYSLRPLLAARMSPDTILAAVRRGTPERAWIEGGGVGSLHYDPQSRHLIVLQTSEMHAEVSKLLGTLGQKLAADR